MHHLYNSGSVRIKKYCWIWMVWNKDFKQNRSMLTLSKRSYFRTTADDKRVDINKNANTIILGEILAS